MLKSIQLFSFQRPRVRVGKFSLQGVDSAQVCGSPKKDGLTPHQNFVRKHIYYLLQLFSSRLRTLDLLDTHCKKKKRTMCQSFNWSWSEKIIKKTEYFLLVHLILMQLLLKYFIGFKKRLKEFYILFLCLLTPIIKFSQISSSP